MRLARFRRAGTEPRPAVLAGDDALVELPHADMLAFLEAGGDAMEHARELATEPPAGSPVPLVSVSLLAPLPRPASIRDCMAFETHVINSTRAMGLGPYARVDRAVERLLGHRFSLAHQLNRTFRRFRSALPNRAPVRA